MKHLILLTDSHQVISKENRQLMNIIILYNCVIIIIIIIIYRRKILKTIGKETYLVKH